MFDERHKRLLWDPDRAELSAKNAGMTEKRARTFSGVKIDLDGRVAARVEDLWNPSVGVRAMYVYRGLGSTWRAWTLEMDISME